MNFFGLESNPETSGFQKLAFNHLVFKPFGLLYFLTQTPICQFSKINENKANILKASPQSITQNLTVLI